MNCELKIGLTHWSTITLNLKISFALQFYDVVSKMFFSDCKGNKDDDYNLSWFGFAGTSWKISLTRFMLDNI